MPHECTNCGRTFPDGSKEMLSGCPDCGGNKFQFTPSRALSGEADGDSAGTSGAGETHPGDGADATTVDDRSGSSTADNRPGSTTVDDRAGSVSAADADAGWDRDGARTRATETVKDWVSRKASENVGDEREPTEASGDRSRASSGDRPAGGRSERTDQDDFTGVDSSEFPEWPETARRPEDRSDAGAADEHPPGGDQARSAGDEPSAETGRRAEDRSADEPTPEESRTRAPMAESENAAQADARSDVISPGDLPTGTVEGATRRRSSEDDASDPDADRTPEGGRVVSEPSGDRPSIEELREELNEQFESIKIVQPGQYELNLMELYNREEYIISLQEDGRYVIEVPDSWREGED